jgi:hypothetical protein
MQQQEQQQAAKWFAEANTIIGNRKINVAVFFIFFVFAGTP